MKNRWLIALSAVGIHISIGSVYAWSVFNLPMVEQLGWARSQVALTFSLAIFFLGLSAALLGKVVEQKGPRFAGTLAGLFFGIGMLGSGLAAQLESIYLLWFSYGILGGIGLGLGYLTPVSTLIKWFPDRRGLATGLAIMGFGFGAMIIAPVFRSIIDSYGIAMAFYSTGIVYLVLMIASASYLEKPPERWHPKGASKAVQNPKNSSDLYQLTARQALSNPLFYGLWLILFINVSCGIGVIYSASPLAQESLSVTAAQAATIVGMMSLFNGLGRLGWASFSDKIGRTNTYLAFFAIQIIAFMLLPQLSNVILFQVVLFTILTCYGGGFATLPAYIGDLFGTKELATIHGYLLTAWAAAGLFSPQLTAYLRQQTGSYATTLYFFSGLFVVALGVAFYMRLFISHRLKEIQIAKRFKDLSIGDAEAA